jgi:hypothetical protein
MLIPILMEAFILLIVLVLLLVSLSRMAGVKRLIEQQSTDLTLLRSEFVTLRQQLKTPALAPDLPKPVLETPPVAAHTASSRWGWSTSGWPNCSIVGPAPTER